MAQGSRQVQTQAQQQVQTLSPQQILVVKLLELPAVELEDRIHAELLENPALEEGKEDTASDDFSENSDTGGSAEDNGANEYDSLSDYLSEDDIPDYKLQENNRSKGEQAEEIPFSDATSFYETLKEQLSERDLTEHQRELAEYLIGSLDDDGLLRKSLDSICDELAIYAGIEWQQGTPEARKFLKFLTEEMGVTKVRFPETSSFGVKPVSVEGTERLVRAAIEFALANHLPSVTLVHKGNIMKFTEGGFKLWGYALAEREFPDKTFTWPQYEKIKKEKGEEAAAAALLDAEAAGKVVVKDVIADAFLQNTLLVPEEYSVIATLNLNGDYVSDQLAAMVGGIGIAPGANINYDSGYAIFEATHGTAPNIAGKNVVNPCSLLLSSVMMLEYMGWNEAGRLITAALEHAFSEGKATRDLARFMPNGQPLGTKEFGEYIMSVL